VSSLFLSWTLQSSLCRAPCSFDGAVASIADRYCAEFAGLEILIGFPVFSSDMAILEAMMQEHTAEAHATETFEAWNAEVKRETT
jgi:hypothetical protein